MRIPGFKDYESAPGDMIERYEALLFEAVHRSVLHLLHRPPR